MTTERRQKCISRNSLLSQLRGSFIPSLRTITTVVGVTQVVESNPNRIYLGFYGDSFAFALDIGLSGQSTVNFFRFQPIGPEIMEFTIDKHPGFPQSAWEINELGGGQILTIFEIVSS